MYTKPFSPQGKTVVVTAATTAPSGVQCNLEGTVGGYQWRIHNSSTTVTAFLSFGKTAAEAEANAVIPSGTPQNSIPLPPGIVEVLSSPVNAYFTAVTASGTATIYISPGAGI